MKIRLSILIPLILFLIMAHGVRAATPLYENSIVSTDFDFILDSDPNALLSVRFVGLSQQEMPDCRNDELFSKAYIFQTTYQDHTRVQIWAHQDFGNQETAENYVKKLADAIGQQPHFNRVILNHVVLHKGDETAFAEEEGRFFIIYSENMDTRIRNHDLQETVFHECAHVAFESAHAEAPAWRKAQQADAGFITAYAAQHPLKEDLPESALFAYVLLNYPGRLDNDVEKSVQLQMPNRLTYFSALPGFRKHQSQ